MDADTENYQKIIFKDCSEIKKLLKDMGYTQEVSNVSLPLVQHLVSDMIQITDQLQTTKMLLNKSPKTGPSDETGEFVFSERMRVIQESNLIHQKYLRLKETSELEIKGKQLLVNQLSSQLEKLKMVNSALSDKLHDLQIENQEMSEKLREWQTKNMNAVVHVHSSQTWDRDQRIELSSLVPPQSNSSNYFPSQYSAGHQTEILRLAEERIEDLILEIERLRNMVDTGDELMMEFRKQIDSRDHEITRLSRLIADESVSVVTDVEECRIVGRLKDEMDRIILVNQELTKRLRIVEAETRNYETRERDVCARNKALENRLENVTKLAHKFEGEKRTIQLAAEHEVRMARGELAKALAELSNIKKRILDIEKRHQLSGSCGLHDNREMEEVLANDHAEKEELLNRIDEMADNERRLSIENERLRTRNCQHLRKLRVNKIEEYLNKVECDRDHWKQKAHDLERRQRARMETGYNSTTRNKNEVSLYRDKKICCPEINCPQSCCSPDRPIDKLRFENGRLKEELRRCHDEIDRLAHKSTSPQRKSAVDRFRTENEQLRQERDNLRSLMDKFERHVSEIQGNVKVLTQERDSLKRLYEETNNELRRARNDVIETGAKGSRQSAVAQSIRRRLEDEKEGIMTDLLRMTTERDSIRERLRTLSNASINEKARLQQAVEDLQVKLRKSEGVIAELTGVTNEVRERAELLQKANEELERDKDGLTKEQHNEAAHRKELERRVDGMHGELNDVRNTLTAAERESNHLRSELQELADQHQALNDHADALENDLNGEREQVRRLRSQLAVVEDGKQESLDRVRELENKLMHTEKEVYNQQRNCQELQSTLSNIEGQITRAEELAVTQANDIRKLVKEKDQMSVEANELTAALDEVRRDRSNLADELDKINRNNRDIQNRLQEVVEENNYYRKLCEQNRENEQQKEEAIRQRGQKIDSLVEENRALITDSDSQRTQIRKLEREKAEMAQALLDKNHDLVERTHDIEKLEHDLACLKDNFSLLQSECEAHRKSELELEAQLKDVVDEKERILMDLANIRELVSQLELSKSGIQHELETGMSEREQLQDAINTMEAELQSAKEQLSEEKRNLAQLEGLLAAAKEAEYGLQLDLQNRATDHATMRERLEMYETRQQDMVRDIAQLRTRNLELEDTVERMQRQLTNERYENGQTTRQTKVNGNHRCSHGCYHTPECLNQLTVGPHDPNFCDHGCHHSDECRRGYAFTEIQLNAYNSQPLDE